MKTKLVKPILVKDYTPVKIGDIMKYIKLHPHHNSELDKELEDCVINVNDRIIESNEYWQKQQLILISPNDEIEIGDKVYDNINIPLRDKVIINEDGSLNNSNGYLKVIATQSQIPTNYIEQFVDEYNKGEVKDIEIETLTELLELYNINKLNKSNDTNIR